MENNYQNYQNYQSQQAPHKQPKKSGSLAVKLAVAAVVIVLVIILAATCVRTVPTGYTGILTTFGRVEDSNLDAGVHIKMPWQKVILMDNRVQKATVQTQAFSSDIQQVDVNLTITYTLNKSSAAGLYATVGTRYYDSIIYPQLMENTKSVFALYSAEGLIEQRDQLALKITEMMRNDIASYGIDVSNIAIEDIDFSDRFTDAIEAKQVATQELQQAQTRQQQETLEAEAAAKRQQIAAEAEAAVARTKADAEAYAIATKAKAEAEANAKIAASLTDDLIAYQEAQSWNGELPTTYVGSADTLPVINVAGAQAAE